MLKLHMRINAKYDHVFSLFQVKPIYRFELHEFTNAHKLLFENFFKMKGSTLYTNKADASKNLQKLMPNSFNASQSPFKLNL